MKSAVLEKAVFPERLCVVMIGAPIPGAMASGCHSKFETVEIFFMCRSCDGDESIPTWIFSNGIRTFIKTRVVGLAEYKTSLT